MSVNKALDVLHQHTAFLAQGSIRHFDALQLGLQLRNHASSLTLLLHEKVLDLLYLLAEALL